VSSIFVAGDGEWSDYTVEAKVKPLSFGGMAGVVFRYHTNRHYYLFTLTDGKKARLALHLPIEKALAFFENFPNHVKVCRLGWTISVVRIVSDRVTLPIWLPARSGECPGPLNRR
jgi:hypothetical protein